MTAPRFFRTPVAFRAWLEANHTRVTELLVGFHRKDSAMSDGLGLAANSFARWAEAADRVRATSKRLDKPAVLESFLPALVEAALSIAARFFSGIASPRHDRRTAKVAVPSCGTQLPSSRARVTIHIPQRTRVTVTFWMGYMAL